MQQTIVLRFRKRLLAYRAELTIEEEGVHQRTISSYTYVLSKRTSHRRKRI